MDMNQELLEALNGIRQEIKQLNQTVAALASQRSERPAPRPAPHDRPERPSRPTGARGRIAGGYKRPSDDEEGTGYGAEMASRFSSKKRSAGGFKSSFKPKSKSGAPKKSGGTGYPKKAR